MQPTIQTAAGRYFNFLQPHVSEIGIEEIAHALSHICRFTGHTRVHYSVAQHSWLASYLVPEEFAYDALMHDAAEALIGDVAKPLKAQLLEYQEIEHGLERWLMRRFRLIDSPEACAAVKHADLVLLITERRDLMPEQDQVCATERPGIEPLPWRIEPLPSWLAKKLFLRRFAQLGGVR